MGYWFGASFFKDGNFTSLSEKLGAAVFAIFEDSRSNLWFGTANGLFRVADGKMTRYTVSEGLAGNDVKAIMEDRQGTLWIATYGGVSRFKDGSFVSLTEREDLPSNRVRSLYEDKEGVIWIGTYDGGLARFKDGRLTSYTTEDGLFNNGVFQILEDRRGNLWMSCNVGIYRASRSQLNDFADGKIQSIACISYGRQDGLVNTECNGGQQPAGVKTRDGRLWFPTQGGVAVIDPDAVAFNQQPPPVVIESCKLDGKSVAFDQPLEISPENENFEIAYTGLSFIKPEHIRFKYRLIGLDGDWIDVGTRRAAYYSHVPPGEYTFTVIAANSDGVWNEAGASIRITVHPPFWKTWWFTLMVALSIAALAIAAYQWRVTRLSRAKAAQEAFSRQLIDSQESERKRIAAELHDSLGQSLAIIKNLALLGMKSPSDETTAREQFERITAQSTQAIDEVKDISYNLRPYLLDRLGLRMAIESMINHVAEASGIEFSARIDELEDVLTKEQEIGLYRIVQESVNNIVKHSGAKKASVEIRRDHHAVEIEVRDNGRGFTAEATEATEKARRGFGLFGIGERAKLMGGSLVIQSAPGQGATIRVKIPIRERELQ